MKQTYDEAMTRVFEDEGGYSNDAGDPGGPTNWGVTIADARSYWKPDATAADVRNMPKSVAEDIMRKHYATPLHYDDLPAGVDYAVLDYGINSGTGRAVRVLQGLVGVSVDGILGPTTLAAVNAKDSKVLINQIYDERLTFLKSLKTWRLFGKGWGRRCTDGRKLALALADKYSTPFDPVAPALVATAGGAAITAGATGHHWILWTGLALGVLVLIYEGYKYYAKGKTMVK